MKIKGARTWVYTLTAVIAVVLLLISVFYFVFVILNFRRELQGTTEEIALEFSTSNATEASGILARRKQEMMAFAAAIPTMDDLAFGLAMNPTEVIAEYRYFKNGDEYYANGVPFDNFDFIESSEVLSVERQKTPAYTPIIYDEKTTQIFLALYVPVVGSARMDGLVAYLSPEYLFADLSFFGESVKTEDDEYGDDIARKAAFACICNYNYITSEKDGIIKLKSEAEEFGLALDYNIFERLIELSNNTRAVDVLYAAVKRGKGTVTTLTIDGDKYAVAVRSIDDSDNHLFLLNIYRPQTLYTTSFTFITQMEGALLFLLVLFLAAVFYLYYLRAHLRDRREKEEKLDPLNGCLTYRYYVGHAEDLMEVNRNTKYAVLFLKVNYVQYIVSQYGDDILNDILRFIGQVFDKCLDQNETYGYISEGNYALLIHYADEVELMNRMRMMHAIIYNYPELKKRKNHVKVTFGVYMLRKTDRLSIYQLVDKAGLALRASDFNIDTIFRFYSDQMGDVAKRHAEIELKMEEALSNGDFRVFYQPKYNIPRDTIDSSEALVRWYDPQLECYYLPGDFISLFEENGFIVKLDHHVFNEVCRFLEDAGKNGQKMVPVSVNVSRVTVTQADFVRYYLAVKKKYGIPDGVLTLEYTESFAFENYEILRTIVRDLREGGIGSSIDDFGSGFSSYNILKELPMDELKLDRFFILPGIDQERDDALLSTTIQLAQRLGMKVTQEGVESLDMMDRLRAFGCNAVQGFYYSKPLPKQEFVDFINREFHST